MTSWRTPGVIEQSAADEILRLDEADKDRGNETQRLQKALAEQEAAKQRIIRLVRLGKISDQEVDAELDSINAEVGRIHAQLSALDSSRSLGGESCVD